MSEKKRIIDLRDREINEKELLEMKNGDHDIKGRTLAVRPAAIWLLLKENERGIDAEGRKWKNALPVCIKNKKKFNLGLVEMQQKNAHLRKPMEKHNGGQHMHEVLKELGF